MALNPLLAAAVEYVSDVAKLSNANWGTHTCRLDRTDCHYFVTLGLDDGESLLVQWKSGYNDTSFIWVLLADPEALDKLKRAVTYAFDQMKSNDDLNAMVTVAAACKLMNSVRAGAGHE